MAVYFLCKLYYYIIIMTTCRSSYDICEQFLMHAHLSQTVVVFDHPLPKRECLSLVSYSVVSSSISSVSESMSCSESFADSPSCGREVLSRTNLKSVKCRLKIIVGNVSSRQHLAVPHNIVITSYNNCSRV